MSEKKSRVFMYFKIGFIIVIMGIMWMAYKQCSYIFPTEIVRMGDDISKAFSRGTNLLIEEGEYEIDLSTSIQSNVVIEGKDNVVISGNNEKGINAEGVRNVEFRNIRFRNLKYIIFRDSSKIKFINCRFEDFSKNGIIMDKFRDFQLIDSRITNIGNSDISGVKIDVTHEGSGLYLSNGVNANISNTEIERTFGHGAIFLVNVKGVDIEHSSIHDTFFRGMELMGTGNSGTIHNNSIYNIGAINNTKSGVGCNGIFASNEISNVSISDNKITNVFENAIEGTFKVIERNTIDGTGVDMGNHRTPSGEAIFANSGIVTGNIIKNSFGAGIKAYSEYKIKNLQVSDNMIYKCEKSDYAIDINSETGYENVDIHNNKSYSNKYCVEVRQRPSKKLITSNNVEK